jgi:Tat protein secretion system quality control protein TatD with DNase activity
MLIDTHCHLTASEFDADREAVIARALQVDVGTILCIADDLIESKKSGL